MAKSFIGISMVVLILALSPFTAQAIEGVAMVNIQKIMRESSAAKSIKQKLEAQQKSFHDEMAAKEKKLQKDERALAQQRSVLAPEEFEKRVKSFRKTAAEAQREVQKKKVKLDNAFAEALTKVQQKITTIVGTVAKAKSLDMVVFASAVVYAKPTMDITAEVLTELNKQMPSVKVNF